MLFRPLLARESGIRAGTAGPGNYERICLVAVRPPVRCGGRDVLGSLTESLFSQVPRTSPRHHHPPCLDVVPGLEAETVLRGVARPSTTASRVSNASIISCRSWMAVMSTGPLNVCFTPSVLDGLAHMG